MAHDHFGRTRMADEFDVRTAIQNGDAGPCADVLHWIGHERMPLFIGETTTACSLIRFITFRICCSPERCKKEKSWRSLMLSLRRARPLTFARMESARPR